MSRVMARRPGWRRIILSVIAMVFLATMVVPAYAITGSKDGPAAEPVLTEEVKGDADAVLVPVQEAIEPPVDEQPIPVEPVVPAEEEPPADEPPADEPPAEEPPAVPDEAPVPIPEDEEVTLKCAPAPILVHKYYDANANGKWDDGEEPLEGWSFGLERKVRDGWVMVTSAVSDVRGVADFGLQPKGHYRVTERLKEGWASETCLPVDVHHSWDKATHVRVGNHPTHVRKDFVLNVNGTAPGVEYYVRYVLRSGRSEVLPLMGTGPYTTHKMLPHMTQIASVEWWAEWHGQMIPLGMETIRETLYRDMVNTFDYRNAACGMKFNDLDHDGEKDEREVGLPNWGIHLLRWDGDGTYVPYARTMTDDEGRYCFYGLLPGEYMVEEVMQEGWMQTLAPDAFKIGNEMRVMGLLLGNTGTAPDISVVKTVMPTEAHVGDDVTWRIEVTNTGNTMLYNVVASDNMFGDSPPHDLMPEESFSKEFPYTVTSVDPDPLVNEIKATGLDPREVEVSDEDVASLDIINPAVMIDKSGPSVVVAGTTVDIDFWVENTGDTPLYDIAIDDDKLGHIGDIPELDPSAAVTFTVSYEATTTMTNIATAMGMDKWEVGVEDADDHTLTVINPSIMITKTVDPLVALAGEDLIYTYVVENTGDVTLYDLVVEDDVLGMIGSIDSLDPGETWNLAMSVEADIDTTNIAEVVGWYRLYVGEPDDEVEIELPVGSVSAQDTAIIDIVNPDVSIVKSHVIDTDGSVVYTYVVENTGDVALFDLVVVDDQLGPIGTFATLPVGGSVSFEAVAVLSETTTNIGTVTGEDEYGHEVTDSDELTVAFAPFTVPDLAITKTADRSTAGPGALVTYTITFTNVGEGAATDFTIVDNYDERYATVVNAGGGTDDGSMITWNLAGPLAPGASLSASYSLRIASTVPTGTTAVNNVVTISHPDDPDTTNNTARYSVSVGEKYLPFTGGDAALLFFGAFAVAIAGATLRRFGRKAA